MTAVVVMARAPCRGRRAVDSALDPDGRDALVPVLGPDRCAELAAALIVAAVEWAHAVAPGAVHVAYEPYTGWVAYEPPDLEAELRPLVPAGTALFGQRGEGIGARVTDAVERALTGGPGPVLVVWPDLPRLRPAHAAAALDDLDSGCELTLGPLIDGGLYLLGMNRPQAALSALSDTAWHTPDMIGLALAAAGEAGIEVGILRAERALLRPSDMRAARADPTLPAELRRILGP